MNRKHLTRVFLGTGLAAGLAAGSGRSRPSRASSRSITSRSRSTAPRTPAMLDNLKKNLAGSLSDDQKADLQAIDSFKEQMKKSDGSNPKKFKFEWKRRRRRLVFRQRFRQEGGARRFGIERHAQRPEAPRPRPLRSGKRRRAAEQPV